MKWFSIFLDRENNPDLSAILGVVAFIFFLYFSYESYIVLKQTFNALDFGGGAGGIVALHGAGKLMANNADYGKGP